MEHFLVKAVGNELCQGSHYLGSHRVRAQWLELCQCARVSPHVRVRKVRNGTGEAAAMYDTICVPTEDLEPMIQGPHSKDEEIKPTKEQSLPLRH